MKTYVIITDLFRYTPKLPPRNRVRRWLRELFFDGDGFKRIVLGVWLLQDHPQPSGWHTQGLSGDWDAIASVCEEITK